MDCRCEPSVSGCGREPAHRGVLGRADIPDIAPSLDPCAACFPTAQAITAAWNQSSGERDRGLVGQRLERDRAAGDVAQQLIGVQRLAQLPQLADAAARLAAAEPGAAE